METTINKEHLYPKRDRNYYKHLKTIEESQQISPKNKELLLGYGTYIQSTGTGKYTTGKRLGQMLVLLEWTQKDLDKMSINDVQQILVQLNNSERSDATKSDYRRSLKQFFAWLEDNDERLMSNDFQVRETTKKFYKFIRKEVRLAYKKRKIDPEQVIDEKDITIMLQRGCQNEQERTILSLFHETGGRIGELGTTLQKHVKINDRGIGEIFFPHSKTEERTVHLIDSVPYLIDHLKTHPMQHDKNFPLFYYIKRLKRGKTRIEYFNHQRFYNLFRDIAKRAGINKKWNPHWMRHSRASLDGSSTLPIDVRCKRMGWVIGSKQLRNYTHISDKQVKDAWMKEKGIYEEEEEEEKMIQCGCRRFVSSGHNHCPHCGRPTSVEVLRKEKEEGNKMVQEMSQLMELIPNYSGEQQQQFIETLKLMAEIARNPKMMEEFRRFKEKENKD